jgi:hypothetical protein
MPDEAGHHGLPSRDFVFPLSRCTKAQGPRRHSRWPTGEATGVPQAPLGLDRTLFDGLGGATTWCGLGLLAHNAAKIAVLIDAKRAGRANTVGPVRDDTHRASSPRPTTRAATTRRCRCLILALPVSTRPDVPKRPRTGAD